MGGTPYLQMWYVYLIRSSYQWIIQQGYMSQRNNSSSFFVLHSWTTILQPNFSYSIMTDLLMPRMFYWCMENHAPASTTLGEIPRERCSFVIERRTEFDVYVTTSDTKEENELKECLYGNPSLPKRFAINQWCMIPPPTGTLWLCGTSVYSILPSQFNGRCTLVYVLPAIRENTHSTSILHIYKIQLLPTKMAAFQDSLVYKRGGQELLVH